MWFKKKQPMSVCKTCKVYFLPNDYHHTATHYGISPKDYCKEHIMKPIESAALNRAILGWFKVASESTVIDLMQKDYDDFKKYRSQSIHASYYPEKEWMIDFVTSGKAK